MLWLTRILVQNGLCVLATWLTIAMLINVVNVIIYYNSPGLDVALHKGAFIVLAFKMKQLFYVYPPCLSFATFLPLSTPSQLANV